MKHLGTIIFVIVIVYASVSYYQIAKQRKELHTKMAKLSTNIRKDFDKLDNDETIAYYQVIIGVDTSFIHKDFYWFVDYNFDYLQQNPELKGFLKGVEMFGLVNNGNYEEMKENRLAIQKEIKKYISGNNNIAIGMQALKSTTTGN